MTRLACAGLLVGLGWLPGPAQTTPAVAVTPALSAAPSILIFRVGAGPATNRVSRFLLLREGTAGPFDITAVRGPDSSGRITWSRAGKSAFRIDLQDVVPRPDWQGRHLRVETTLPGLPALDIPIRIESADRTPSCRLCDSPTGHAGLPHPGKPTGPPDDGAFRPVPPIQFEP